MTDEQTLLRESVLVWSEENQQPSTERWKAMARLGWQGMTLPEAYGGSNQGLAEACVLAQALGDRSIAQSYADLIVLAAEFIAQTASAEQAARWLPSIIDGSMRVAPAQLEPGITRDAELFRTRAIQSRDQWQIDGEKRPVCGLASHYLLCASSDVGTVFFVIARDHSGLEVREFEAVDGERVAALKFKAVMVNDSQRLTSANLRSYYSAQDRATLVACAEEVGAMQAALRATIEYTRTREQFGKPLAANQVVAHRLADMSIACEEAQAMVQGAVLEIAEADRSFLQSDTDPLALRARPHSESTTQAVSLAASQAYARAASLARAKVSKLAQRVLEEAIQLHGGMGVTDELAIAHYLRRHLALDARFGDARGQLDRYARLPRREGSPATGVGNDPALTKFRDEVRQFLRNHLSDDLVHAARLNTSVFSEPKVSLPWQRKLFDQGWVAPAWPKEYGGTGWSLAERWVFETELAQAGAPSLSPLGLRMAGPVIMKFGTAEQKAHYLPRLLAGEDYWCQGYSEPGSGSDLASLKMRAEALRSDGNEPMYRINGSKIWTSHAQHANRMFALVRTGDAQTRKHDGISFVLIDMGLPGITVRPIMSASGDHEVNQVFFDDVLVPMSCRLGEEGQGWKIAKYLLEFERGGAITAGQLRAALSDSWELAISMRSVNDHGDELTSAKRSDLAQNDHKQSQPIDVEALNFASIEGDIRALEMCELRIMSSLTVGQNPGSVSSMLKLRWSEIHQDITRLNLRLLGTDALFWEGARPLHVHEEDALLEDCARPVTAGYLNARAFTIFGGTSEIQREIIARELLS